MTNEERFGFPSGIEDELNEAHEIARQQVVRDFNALHQAWLQCRESIAKYILPDEHVELDRITKQMNTAIDFLADLTD